MAITTGAPQPILVGGARIDLQNVRIREDIVLDELHLEGGDVVFEPGDGEREARITTGETRVRAMMSEANLNRLAAANLPEDAPVRNIEIALLSGRARISGKAVVTVVPVPFSVEATPRVENGVRVMLDCRAATFGIGLPRSVLDIVQQKINELLSLDVSEFPIAIWIDEIRCEPARLTAIGRARIAWPPQAAIAAIQTAPRPAASSGFTISERPLFGESAPHRPAITAGPAPAESPSSLP